MSKLAESAACGQDQILNSANELRAYLQSKAREALRWVIEEEVAALCGDRYLFI